MLNNPAGRLYALLVKANALSDKKHYLDAWRELLLPPHEQKDTFAVFERLGPVFMLPNQAVVAIRQLKLDAVSEKHLLEWVPGVEQAFLLSFHSMWSQFRNSFKDKNAHCLYSLKTAAIELARFSRERELPEDELKQVLQDVQDLREKVRTATISPELKSILLKYLREVETAIEEYQIRGASGVAYAASAAVGAVLFADTQEKDDNPILWEAFQRLRGIAAWAQFGAALLKLGEGAADIANSEWFREVPAIVVPDAPKLLNGEVMPEDNDPK
jgi:hypothetical protein